MARDIGFADKGGYIIVREGKLVLLSTSEYNNLTKEEKEKIAYDLKEWTDSHED